MIFRKGGHVHNKKFGMFAYGEKSNIEIVSNYTYLGIPFSNSSVFLNAANSAISSTKIALNTTVSLIKRMGLNSWLPIKKLLNGLVLSVLMYAILVWGLRYLDEIEQVQSIFYKLILNVSQVTPGYAIRLETGSSKLSVKFFELVLNYIEKILLMSDSRYLKLCFLRLKRISESAGKESLRYNWYMQVGKIFRYINKESEMNSLTPLSIQRCKDSWTSEYEKLLYDEDL